MIKKLLEKYRIQTSDETVKRKAEKLWDEIMKPLRSLGEFEDLVIKLAGIYGDTDFEVKKRCAVVVCADHGVVSEGVSQSDSHVTSVVAGEIAAGMSNINVFAMAVGADVYTADLGMLEPPDPEIVCSIEDVNDQNDFLKESIIDLHIARGTCNMAKGPAMTLDQALQAVENGIKLVERMKSLGYDIIVTGEMGIGNSSASSALCSALLGRPASEVTGRGAGLDSDTFRHKIDVIDQAVKLNFREGQDIVEILAGLGGFDIAAMAGMYIGGAVYRVPVVIDGFISAVAALVAYRIEPAVRDFMLASHLSAEGPVSLIFDELGLNPIIRGNLRLGEGTGGVCLLPLLDIAVAEFRYAHRFTDTDVDQYKRLY